MFRLSKGLLLGVATAQFNVIIAMQQTASSILNYSKNNISMLYRTEKIFRGDLGGGHYKCYWQVQKTLLHTHYHNHKYVQVQITHWFSGHVPNHPSCSWLNGTLISEYGSCCMHVTATPSFVLRIGFLRPRYSWKFFQFCKFASYFNIDSLVWFVLDSSRMNTWVHQSGISYSNEKISSLALSIFFNDVSSSSAGLMSKHQKVETTWLMVTGFDEYPAGTLLALSWQCI